MTDYQKEALDFLITCNATMEIKYVGLSKPNWDDKPHCVYECTIKTPKGSMVVHFYDSAYNTELKIMNAKKYEATPTEYNILACLEKYEVGSMDDFMDEFGYEVHSVKDMTNFINTYNEVVKEYNNLCRIFTPEQMEKLREIY